MDLGVCDCCGDFEGRCLCGRGKVVITADKRERVSKFLSGLLRHFAPKFGLEIDRYGWVDLHDVLKVLQTRYGIGEVELRLIVKYDRKRRFEIREGKIRAKYGHSLPVETGWSEDESVPEKLYHATHPRNVASILKNGLLPMKRREVHMCDNAVDAIEVGRRHHPNPVLIEIDAANAGKVVEIRKKGRIYTADRIPPEFLRVACLPNLQEVSKKQV